MPQKYRQIIHSQTKQALSHRLHKTVYPAIGISFVVEIRCQEPAISQSILRKIDGIIPNTTLQEFAGNESEISEFMKQEVSRVTDLLYPDMLFQLVSELKKALPELNKHLIHDRHPLDSCDESLQKLMNHIEKYGAGSADYWVGANVAVLPDFRIDLDNEFLQVSTNGDVTLAKQISWVMIQLRFTMKAYLDYQNKHVFYREVAEAMQQVIERSSFESSDVFVAILSAAVRFKEDGQDGTENYFERRQQYLNAVQCFIEDHEAAVLP
mgnify:CR=1 FL=1